MRGRLSAHQLQRSPRRCLVVVAFTWIIYPGRRGYCGSDRIADLGVFTANGGEGLRPNRQEGGEYHGFSCQKNLGASRPPEEMFEGFYASQLTHQEPRMTDGGTRVAEKFLRGGCFELWKDGL